ncbi:MAG TPA: fumarylacetoacetate hydrolase family protein [Actinomycetota bacterium]|nr:fumarylacetoacetate hydrolase family protein [Actinomycetota bacterium]
MTFDRWGHRRLGALLEGEVVDLPDLVGHPAFPTSMEALVSSNGGTVLDAARAALERDEAATLVVKGARLLPPILPTSLRSRDTIEGVRRVAGPGDQVPWPAGAGWLEYEPRIAAILGRSVRDAGSSREVEHAVFGYTLVSDFAVRDGSGDPTPRPEGLPVAIGPCVLTADEIDPQTEFVTVRVDGDQWAKGNLNGTAHDLLDEVAAASRLEALEPGEAFAASPLASLELDHRIWPGAEIELEAERIGILRNRIDSLR